MAIAASAPEEAAESEELRDPYVLDPAKIMEPPKGWGPSLRFLGPGMVTSAAVVGSGELLTATTLGARTGFMLLWLVFVSTFVKVAVQIELARWSISTGKAAMTGYNQVPPKLAGRSWISYLGLLMFLQIVIGQGGVLGAGALALSMVMPIGGDPYSTLSIGFWVLILVVVAIAIHLANKYEIVENVSTALVVLVTVLVVVMVFGIQATPFAWSGGDLASGLQFRIAAGAMGVALSMFGMTGVGGGEITAYTYWCVEKGYAAWTGPNDGSDEWKSRARGWISVMKKDAWLSWVIYTISTASFYILGAAVLNPQGLEPSGNEVLEVISRMFTDTIGPWSKVVFLIGAAIALFKTIVANVPGFARQISNTLAIFNVFNWTDLKARNKWMKGLMVALPIIWGLFAIALKSPLAMVIVAGIGNAIFLMAIVVATLYLSYTETDKAVKDGTGFTIYLMISAVAVFAVGVLSLISTL
ncbi:Nramp family divalent metal transporter [Brooklawnia cerclae]|uniref:Mn2+/Fe2+ NRAMP family transporter n=1 Tax=Brooklawnia cerclae TaxID=349934 RepID=A0ABX0SCE3_9ACTN|nr:Nramp family divalent metal transporter [Brooklawnia cerclae]NIH55705.1 Mn2+/Fe2+ NRAMP family transporter [Brooklawnia cerclae]